MYAVYQNSYSGNINQLSPEFVTEEAAKKYLSQYGREFTNLEVLDIETVYPRIAYGCGENDNPQQMEEPQRTALSILQEYRRVAREKRKQYKANRNRRRSPSHV